MIAGRALGHTGGTLDKLEAIPGFRTALTTAEIGRVLARAGFVLAGQTARLVPADRALYALRDATAHRRVDPAHRVVDPVEEAGRGGATRWSWTSRSAAARSSRSAPARASWRGR